MKRGKDSYSFLTTLAVLLLLLGIFASARTIVNFLLFSKYPTTGVITLNFSGVPTYSGPREDDCESISSYPGDQSSAASIKMQKDSCLSSVRDTREAAKTNDISTSVMFLFLGGGLLAAPLVQKAGKKYFAFL
ncbi:hypothetical protein A2866_06335 [Candidatus Roizmanbacteria bacterium RIFCSPHIGHO2_01_FULL_39_8]|uniref:Uncharacterized protein n=3 Tax=Candidatus Roizmaniibacteriota TaxID=1752723 RepID=A0A1F7GM54_9BACT|nr:MAG: hypothetical protein A2866_06335 [Candidatus Roizmanbacteria bacterium RIFCSPHIGHO2_01_FULL_39_8]OGK25956.1 MAG: hypothetical protein A3C28_06505 [Candidatus Roizmanbacteria bacterium RIFCSPHIGHO2_02_FULL_39_9]OGK34785.1 MAG: hypothetical protein A3F60_05090 [Candidatus Roizmanbacteria bacterium RIFCSPHIGHO2_12_FULL_39_8]